MARIEISSVSNPYGTGELQLQNKVAMSGTLTAVTDNLNTASSLQLSTTTANFTGNVTSSGTINEFTLSGHSGDRRIYTNSNYFFLMNNSGTVFQMQGGKFCTSQFEGTAKFNIRGTGSTSATSSLIVQNSATTETFSVKDNGSVRALSTLNVSGDGSTGSSSSYGFVVYDNGNGYSKSLFHCQSAQTYVFANPQGVSMDGFEKFSGGLRINGGVDLSLMTDANLRMKILSSNGNVGIGTSTPTDKLDVNGNIKVGASAFVYSSAGGGAVTSGMYFDSTTPKASVYLNSAEKVIFGNSTTATIKGSGSTNATTSLLIQNSSGTELMRVYDDGTLSNYATFRLGTSSGGGASVFENAGNTLNLSADNNHDVGYTQIKARRTGAGGGVRIENTNYPSNPDNSAQLDVFSTTKGFLPPRMTDAQIRAIVSPTNGLIAYNTDINHLCCYQAGAWVKFSHTPM